MSINSFYNCPIKVLTEEGVSRIHQQAIDVLSQLGITVKSAQAIKLIEEFGAKCDWQTNRVYLDENNIRQALKTVTSEYTIYARDQHKYGLDINLQNYHTISGGAAIKVLRRGSYEEACVQDLINATVLHDKLDNIDIIINAVEPMELKNKTLYSQIAAKLFAYTRKPLLLQAADGREVRKLFKMASLLTGGADVLRKYPVFMTGANAEPPLMVTKESAEVLIEAASLGVPCSFGCYVMAGLTSPYDVASTLVQRTAMVLFGLVLTQASNPGSSYTFSCHSGCCNLSTGDVVTMSPRAMQIIAGSVQMGRYYGLTTHSLSATESKRGDGQAAAERMFSVLTSVMAGASMVQGVTGEMSGMELFDYGQCVIDNEIAGYIKQFTMGIDESKIDDSFEIINETVNNTELAGLGYLGHPSTLAQCISKSPPDLFSVGMLAKWLESEKKDLYANAVEKAEELIKDRVMYIDNEQKEELDRIAEE